MRPFAERGAHVQFLDRLHAKVYLSEREALVTSMNLTRSARESWEIGTLFGVTSDAEHYRQVQVYAQQLFKLATVPPSTGSRSPPVPSVGAGAYCIRCAARIADDPSKPLCRGCYAAWSEYENENYQEAYCHRCGRGWASSMAKPLCRTCWSGSA